MNAKPQHVNPTLLLTRAQSLNLDKLGVCEIHNTVSFYYCQKSPQCVENKPYFCSECAEVGGTHLHPLMARDKFCNQRNQEFQQIFDLMESLHDASVDKYKQQEVILVWASKEFKKLQNPQNTPAKDRLSEDYRDIVSYFKKVSDARDKINQYCVDYKAVEIVEIMKMIPEVQSFIKRVDYYRKLDADLIFKEYKSVFQQRNPNTFAERRNQEFVNRHAQFQIRALFEENDDLKAQNELMTNVIIKILGKLNISNDKDQDAKTFFQTVLR
eukprot:403367893